jgi:2,3-bisphosphoglycerate-independent phosphoglycerate mutase
MDGIAARGAVGLARHVPSVLPPGSDVANMSLLGYDPLTHFTGRAPIEAAALGIALGPQDWAVRCNLVTIEDQVMKDFTAGHVSTAEATELLKTAQDRLDRSDLQFVPGVSYRNLLIYRAADQAAPFSPDTRTTPPHDLTDQSVLDHYPRGPGSDLLSCLMSESVDWFARHPVNEARRAAGKLPATNVWLWGQGRAPSFEAFASLHGGLRGVMITAVDLLRGLAKLIGWESPYVPGATGYTDTDYAAKGRAAIEALREVDLVCVHIEAPDEASHEGNCAAKIRALEEIDRHIVAPLAEVLAGPEPGRILVCPDHPTPLRTKTHSHGLVPFAMAGPGISADRSRTYDEPSATAAGWVLEEGWKLMESFVGGAR